MQWTMQLIAPLGPSYKRTLSRAVLIVLDANRRRFPTLSLPIRLNTTKTLNRLFLENANAVTMRKIVEVWICRKSEWGRVMSYSEYLDWVMWGGGIVAFALPILKALGWGSK
jgi:hypothetical protein